MVLLFFTVDFGVLLDGVLIVVVLICVDWVMLVRQKIGLFYFLF